MLILVVGPSGAGKDTLIDAARGLLDGDRRFRFAQRHITRPRDAGGEAHIAVTTEDFARARAAGAYALSWEAHGLGYGIPADIADDVAAGVVVVANISRTVIAEAARQFPVQVLEITAPPAVLAARLAERGREDAAEVTARLGRSMALPEGVVVVTVVNDASVAEGAAQVMNVLSRAALFAR